MSSSAKLVIAAGFVGASIIAAAQLARRSGAPASREPAPAGAVPPRAGPSAAPESVAPAEPGAPGKSASSYRAIAERDIFRPLIVPPRGPEGVEVPSLLVSDEEAQGSGPGVRATTATPGAPPDPAADLALTGITQVGGRLRALLEKVSARTGRYVSVGDEFHGFRVVKINATSVVLEKDGKRHTLRLGGKALAPRLAEKVSTAGQTPKQTAEPTPRPTASAPAPTAPAGFGPDMLSWAEGMSLADLERAYSQYRDHLSPEQRAQADAYVEQRRARGY